MATKRRNSNTQSADNYAKPKPSKLFAERNAGASSNQTKRREEQSLYERSSQGVQQKRLPLLRNAVRYNRLIYSTIVSGVAAFVGHSIFTSTIREQSSTNLQYALQIVGLGKMMHVIFKFRKVNPLPNHPWVTFILTFVLQFAIGTIFALYWGKVPYWITKPAVVFQHVLCYCLIFWSPADIVFAELQKHTVLQVGICSLYNVAKVRGVEHLFQKHSAAPLHAMIPLAVVDLFGNFFLTKLYIWLVHALSQPSISRRQSLASKGVHDLLGGFRFKFVFSAFSLCIILLLYLGFYSQKLEGETMWGSPLTVLAFVYLSSKDFVGHAHNAATYRGKK